ncbi:MAG: hypothetical protein Q9228_003672 [Teloschistes exilis]
MDVPSDFEIPLIVLPLLRHRHTIIALYGRGNEGSGLAEELFEQYTSASKNLQQLFPSVKWVFPSSQERYSTVFQEEIDEWFDIYSLTDPAAREELQTKGLHDSVRFLLKVLNDEADIIGQELVFLLGISQGCATGLMTLLAGDLKLGGFIGLNGWLPFRAQIEASFQKGQLAEFFSSTLDLGVRDHICATPFLLGHNVDDEMIDIELGHQARDSLLSIGMTVIWHEEQEGGHLGMLNSSGLDTIAAFMKGPAPSILW